MSGPIETNRNPYRIYISYSHEDSAFVQPVVKLLRTGDEPIFFDIENLRAGNRWREQLDAALTDARLLIVFWCLHSSRSAEVSREYLAAISAAKDVVPVLLDWTPLPAALAAFQWIDLRRLGRSEHGWFTRPGAKVSRYAFAILLCVSVLTGLALWLKPGNQAPSSSVSPTSVPAAPNPETTTSTPVTIPPPVTALLKVPDLTGGTPGGALAVLADIGLVVGLVSTEPSTAPAGTVVFQRPAAGSLVPPGTRVDVVLSMPPASSAPTPLVWWVVAAVFGALVSGWMAAKARSGPARKESATRRQRRAARILTREVASRLDPQD